jgi:hypothetical protein
MRWTFPGKAHLKCTLSILFKINQKCKIQEEQQSERSRNNALFKNFLSSLFIVLLSFYPALLCSLSGAFATKCNKYDPISFALSACPSAWIRETLKGPS